MKRIVLTIALIALAEGAFGSPSSTPAKALDAERNSGLLVTQVLPDTPAQRAGIVRGDILVRLDGTKVTNPQQVRSILARHSAGDTISAVIIHGSRSERVSIRLEVRLYHPILGLDFSRGAAAGTGSGRAASAGVYVDSVAPKGPAERAGIRAGDLILSVNGSPVDAQHTLVQLVDRYDPGSRIQLRIKQPNGEELTIAVQLGRSPKGTALLGLRYSNAPPQGSAIGNLLKRIDPPRWFRYFGEPLFPNQNRAPSNRAPSAQGASGGGSST